MTPTDYVDCDALDLAELVRSGQVSPAELLDRGARPDGCRQSADQRRDPPDGGARARRNRRGPARRAVPRRAVPDQGPDDGLRRRADALRLAAVQGFRAARGRGTDAALPGGRPRDLRQDQHAGARRLQRHRARAVRPDPQSVEPRAHLERLERRVRRGRRGAHRAGGECQRWRRFDPHAGVELRAGRPEAESRSQPDRSAGAGHLVGIHRRARRHAHRPRLRGAARCHGRRLPAATDEAAAARASLPRGDAARGGPDAHRVQLRPGARQDAAPGESQGPRGDRRTPRSTRPRGGRGPLAAAAGDLPRVLCIADLGRRRGHAAHGQHDRRSRGDQRRRRARHLDPREDGRGAVGRGRGVLAVDHADFLAPVARAGRRRSTCC